jgi:DNA-binding CsgD family transcriptional regulator
MNIVYLIYLLFIAGSTFVLYFTYRLKKKYGFKFLDYFFSYLIFFIVYGFIYYIGGMFIGQLFLRASFNRLATKQLIFLVCCPAIMFSIYFMILWIFSLAEQQIKTWFKISYWIIQGLIMTGVLIEFNRLLNIDQTVPFGRIMLIVSRIFQIMIYSALFSIYLLARSSSNPERKKLLKRMGYIYITGYTILILFSEYIRLPFYSKPAYFSLFISSLFLALNLPVLFYLYTFIKRHGAKISIQAADPAKLDYFFSNYGITDREKDIILLVIRGKSNKEIGKTLFISPKTVKNTIYKIYKKIGINNRIQLTNIIQSKRT